MPWNPAVWWILSRLRLAVELDCDARVLRAGTPAGPYGSLLIDIAALHAGVRTPAPALLEAPNHLHRRLLAMQQQSHRFASLRGAAAAGIAATALVVACRAELPTTAQVESMDAASALRLAQTGTPQDSVVFKLDGVIVSVDSARRVPASRIRRVEVARGVNLDGAKGPATIEMSTSDLVALSPATSAETKVAEAPRIVTRDPSAGGVKIVTRPASQRIKEFDGLVFVDGKRADASVLATLDRLSITSVEVIKGASARARYKDPAAEFGVILISTR
jgi:hypothetical protein